MSAKQPFVISVLSKKNMHPLSAAAALSGVSMFDMSKSNIDNLGLQTKINYDPPARNAKVIFSDLITINKDNILWKDLPEFLQVKEKVKQENIRNLRNNLWLKIDWLEKRADSQYAKLISMPIPNSLSIERSENILKKFAFLLAEKGMIVDVAIHESGGELGKLISRQAFAMITTRPFYLGKFTNKNRDWNEKASLINWRSEWFNLMLKELESAILNNEILKEKVEDWLKIANRYIVIESPEADGNKKSKDFSPFNIEEEESIVAPKKLRL